MKTKFLPMLVILFVSTNLFAQASFLAGRIHTEQTSSLSFKVTVEVYTPLLMAPDSIQLCYGDGTCEQVPVQSDEAFEEIGLSRSIAQSTHTYGGEGSYIVGINECCWSGQGLNTSGFGNSMFSLFHEVGILDPVFQGPNNSPVDLALLNFMFGYPYEPLNFATSFIDPEGDSLSLQFLPPRGDQIVTDTYQLPDAIDPGPENDFTTSINNLNWESPQQEGLYQIGYELTEFRQGIPISTSYGVSMILIQLPTATEEGLAKKFRVYPNPTSDWIKIEGINVERIEVYNVLGERVLSQNGASENISLANLPTGPYVISVKNDNEQFSRIIVKH